MLLQYGQNSVNPTFFLLSCAYSMTFFIRSIPVSLLIINTPLLAQCFKTLIRRHRWILSVRNAVNNNNPELEIAQGRKMSWTKSTRETLGRGFEPMFYFWSFGTSWKQKSQKACFCSRRSCTNISENLFSWCRTRVVVEVCLGSPCLYGRIRTRRMIHQPVDMNPLAGLAVGNMPVSF